MGKNPSPTSIAGTGTFPVYPSPLPVGEPDYLSCHASIRPKEVQQFFDPNLNNHIYCLCVLGTLVQFFLTISASSTSTPASRALVPLASSIRFLCHICSSSSQPRSFSSASPRPRHLYPGEEKTSPIAKVRPQVSLFIEYVVPVGDLLPDRCPMGTGIGKNLYPRQLTGMGT